MKRARLLVLWGILFFGIWAGANPSNAAQGGGNPDLPPIVPTQVGDSNTTAESKTEEPPQIMAAVPHAKMPDVDKEKNKGAQLYSIIYAPSQTEYIMLLQQPDKRISFYYCEDRNATSCRALGTKHSYRLKDIHNMHNQLRHQAYVQLFSDALVVFSIGAGFVTPPPVAVGFGTLSFIVRTYLVSYTDSAVWYVKFRKAKTIGDNVFNGKNQSIDCSVETFAEDLDNVLKNIF